jgi:hypothetical protein
VLGLKEIFDHTYLLTHMIRRPVRCYLKDVPDGTLSQAYTLS